MRAIPETLTRTRGFTLVELVVILAIVGVLAVFATGRFADQDSFEARGYHDELVVAARYAQRTAIASGCDVRFAITAGGAYAVTFAGACHGAADASAVQRPDGGDFSRPAPPAGVTVSSGAFTTVFNAHGDSTSGGSIAVSGGGANLSFTITPGSGFVDTP